MQHDALTTVRASNYDGPGLVETYRVTGPLYHTKPEFLTIHEKNGNSTTNHPPVRQFQPSSGFGNSHHGCYCYVDSLDGASDYCGSF